MWLLWEYLHECLIGVSLQISSFVVALNVFQTCQIAQLVNGSTATCHTVERSANIDDDAILLQDSQTLRHAEEIIGYRCVGIRGPGCTVAQ